MGITWFLLGQNCQKEAVQMIEFSLAEFVPVPLCFQLGINNVNI